MGGEGFAAEGAADVGFGGCCVGAEDREEVVAAVGRVLRVGEEVLVGHFGGMMCAGDGQEMGDGEVGVEIEVEVKV